MEIQRVNKNTEAFLTETVQSHQVFDYLIQKHKRADKIIISSFAITEAYVRRIIRNREFIGHIELYLDFTIASRNIRGAMFAEHNVDELWLTNNHSKVIYISSGSGASVAIMSNNATNNHRFESGVISSCPDLCGFFLRNFEEMKKKCVRLNGD
jgi:hypothetical protein